MPSSSLKMPKDWALILTNAPLFSQKARILDRLILAVGGINPGANGSFGSDSNQQQSNRNPSFVLGDWYDGAYHQLKIVW